MLTFFDELSNGRGPSAKLWAGFAPPIAGGFETMASGNPAFGFYDDFLWKASTSLYDGYFTLQTGTGTVTRIASTYDPSTAALKLTTGLGLLQFFNTADDDEAIMSFGNALDAPFNLGSPRDLCFECRLNCATIAASQYGLFVGLAELGAQATTEIIHTDNAIDNTYDLLGFQKLFAETTAVDGMYQVGGQTKVDGAVNTGLDSLATLVALRFVKLGFRYRATTQTIHWYVNGVEDVGARLIIPNITSGTFPDDNFMTPMIALASGGTDDYTTVVDWWACAQAL